MVVVSGSWGKNAATYPTPASNDMVIATDTNKMTAKAIVICRPNSHPFLERTLCLDQPVKVGRSVARTRATLTNALFDCKVLSRHHALLWYENGKFYLQDTKSSNGTYVNNNRLSSNETDPHEVSSGDIVQFGVDVLENNRKVTHGCIIAILKLYLPDGREAKASPSIPEGHKQGYVPLDELYKLNQVIQEASQRELCLETKLTALQQVVTEARKSADESWQAYVGEERLLSRVAALERQLMQAGKGWSDEKIKEELEKLQEERATYQVAAKEALRKLHAERLEAIAIAAEQQRARATAEQESILVKEQLSLAQQDIQVIVQKLSEEQKKMYEDKTQHEQRERELQARLDSETEKLTDIQMKLDQLRAMSLNPSDDIEKSNIICDEDCDLKMKKNMLEELLEDNEAGGDLNKTTNGVEPEHNRINIRVSPLGNEQDQQDSGSESETESFVSEDPLDCKCTPNEGTCGDDKNSSEGDCDHGETFRPEKEDSSSEIHVDSRTLKYQFQTAQNELKKQLENMQKVSVANQARIQELEQLLQNEKRSTLMKSQECECMKQELGMLEQQFKTSSNESQQLKDKVKALNEPPKEDASGKVMVNGVNLEEFTALEEELVVLKEGYERVSNEKVEMSKQLSLVRDEYNSLCNRSYNNMFFYVAPLVLMVLYLLISNIFS